MANLSLQERLDGLADAIGELVAAIEREDQELLFEEQLAAVRRALRQAGYRSTLGGGEHDEMAQTGEKIVATEIYQQEAAGPSCTPLAGETALKVTRAPGTMNVMNKRVDIQAMLADPVLRRQVEEALRMLAAPDTVSAAPHIDPVAHLAELRAARRRGQARWKGTTATERSAHMKAIRQNGGGMPRSKKPRCWCGKYTVDSATQRRFDCCKRAGVYPGIQSLNS